MLKDGDVAVVRQDGRFMKVAVNVTDTIGPGLAVLEGKWWGGEEQLTAQMNRLTGSRWSPHGQPAYNETLITIERS
jgi:anaerobic selenocysteine-containing dehydrogenase